MEASVSRRTYSIFFLISLLFNAGIFIFFITKNIDFQAVQKTYTITYIGDMEKNNVPDPKKLQKSVVLKPEIKLKPEPKPPIITPEPEIKKTPPLQTSH